MSVPSWLNDGQFCPNNEQGSFHPNGDSTMALMQTPTTSPFEFNQMQNSHVQQQRTQNGSVRNGSPAYHNPMYSTQPLIPSKRPRAQEDHMRASPQQHPGLLPASRSQTPQGQYSGFQGNFNGGQQFSAATPYQQFGQSGPHASQSPVVQNQTFNSQVSQQRVQTMSPSPFSPASQNFAPHASSPQSENGSRVNTPQNGGPQYAQNHAFVGASNQAFTPPIGSTVNGVGISQYNQHLQAQHHQQQQHLRVNEARLRHMQQQRQQSGALNPVTQPPPQMAPHQIAAFRAQQAQQVQQRSSNPESSLLRNLSHFAHQHGQQFNPQPVIAGKPINSIHLFLTVMKMGGSKKITSLGQWPHLASLMQFQEQHQMIAAQGLQSYWQASLAGYEQLLGLQHQRRAMGDSLRNVNQGQVADASLRQDTLSPTKQMHDQPPQPLMQPLPHMQNYQQIPANRPGSQSIDPRQPQQNGYMASQQNQAQAPPTNSYGMLSTPLQTLQRATIHSESQRTTAMRPTKLHDSMNKKSDPWPAKQARDTEFKPSDDSQVGQTERTWGGIQLGPQAKFVEAVGDLLKYKLSVPRVEELGLIDVRALTLSLRSGVNAEVRLALDTFASLSKDYSALNLENCEDLLETLVDCADDQVQLLADNSAEVSEEMMINSYEETIRGCRLENATLHEISEFGTLDHYLDRAVHRLICITTIIRNLSFLDFNQNAIADPIVVKLMATTIRSLGTRSTLLRTHRNVLDISKDILTILSNVSQFIDLPGKEEALCVLHFLLSFAPSSISNNLAYQALSFPPFRPRTHRYYPQAVDSMAKLLARGDPNRTFFRLIFASDSISSPPFDLLTRSFGLAIAAIPEMAKLDLTGVLKARLPFLLQGLLSAEILASLIPSSEYELAQLWLASQDGFALSLVKIVTDLGKRPQPSLLQRHYSSRIPDADPFGYTTFIDRGYALLRKLAEKAKDVNGNSKGIPYDVLPKRQSVVDILKLQNVPANTIKQLCALSSMDT